MRIFVDITEPGIIFQHLSRRCEGTNIHVERTILHKREGSGGALRETHPFYGLGADFIISDDTQVPLAAIERKTLEDLARSVSLREPQPKEPRLFRQLRDLMMHPTPILLIEGRPSVLYRRVEPAILGLQFWLAREGIAVMFSTSPTASATAVFLMARKLVQEFEAPADTEMTAPEPQLRRQ